jgi:hypothetical protein
MRTSRNIIALCAAAAFSMPSIASAQPLTTDTYGWLDFRGSTQSDEGGQIPAAGGARTGPYRAGFSNVSLALAQAGTQFDVFCIDWLSGATDSKINVLTLGTASTDAGLLAKFAPSAGTGLTLGKLQQAAWLSQQFNANGSNWNDVHHAMWSLFVPIGGGNPALPALTGGASNWVASSQAAVSGGFTGDQFRVLLSVNENGLFNAANQVLIVELPEPANFLLVGTAFFSLVFFARRKSQGNA